MSFAAFETDIARINNILCAVNREIANKALPAELAATRSRQVLLRILAALPARPLRYQSEESP